MNGYFMSEKQADGQVVELSPHFFRVNGNVAQFTEREAQILEELAESISDTVWVEKKDPPGVYHTMIARDCTLPSNKDFLFVVSKTREDRNSPFTYYFSASVGESFFGETQDFTKLESVVRSYVNMRWALADLGTDAVETDAVPKSPCPNPAGLTLVINNP